VVGRQVGVVSNHCFRSDYGSETVDSSTCLTNLKLRHTSKPDPHTLKRSARVGSMGKYCPAVRFAEHMAGGAWKLGPDAKVQRQTVPR
jgi:hypothetical protein